VTRQSGSKSHTLSARAGIDVFAAVSTHAATQSNRETQPYFRTNMSELQALDQWRQGIAVPSRQPSPKHAGWCSVQPASREKIALRPHQGKRRRATPVEYENWIFTAPLPPAPMAQNHCPDRLYTARTVIQCLRHRSASCGTGASRTVLRTHAHPVANP